MWLLAIILDSADLDHHGFQSLLAPSSSLCTQPLWPAVISNKTHARSLHRAFPFVVSLSYHVLSSLFPNFFIWLATTFPSLPQIMLSTYLFTCLWSMFCLSTTTTTQPTHQPKFKLHLSKGPVPLAHHCILTT